MCNKEKSYNVRILSEIVISGGEETEKEIKHLKYDKLREPN